MQRSFGSRLKMLRKSREMTQAQLAELAAVTPQYIGALERGQAKPSFAVIEKLCLLLQVTPIQLFLFSLPDTKLPEGTPSLPLGAPFSTLILYFRCMTSGEELWSESLCEMLGVLPSRRRPSLDLLLEHVLPQDRQDIEDLFRSFPDRSVTRCFRFTNRAGDVRQGRIETFALRKASEGPKFVQAVITDITDSELLRTILLRDRESLEASIREYARELSRTERSLREENRLCEKLQQDLRLYGKIVEAAADAVVYLDRDHVLRAVNPAFERLLGMSANQLLHRSITDIPELASFHAGIAKQLGKALTGETIMHEAWFHSPHGKGRYLQLACTPSLEQDLIVGVVCVCRDLTPHKMLEISLRDAEALLRSLLDATQDRVVLLDREGRILTANKATLQALGNVAIPLTPHR